MRTPAGVTATPAEGTVTDGAQRITLTAARDAAQGFADVKVTVTSGDSSYEQPVALTVAAPGTLLAAYDNTGVSDDDGDHDEADFDGGGWSYSRQALAAAGLTPGKQATIGGLAFTWPASPAGRPDNASATGQTIRLPAPADRLSFIGSAVNGNQQTRATVTYTDGTTDTVDLSFTDWTVGGGRRHRPVRQRDRRPDRVPQRRRRGQGPRAHVRLRHQAVHRPGRQTAQRRDPAAQHRPARVHARGGLTPDGASAARAGAHSSRPSRSRTVASSLSGTSPSSSYTATTRRSCRFAAASAPSCDCA